MGLRFREWVCLERCTSDHVLWRMRWRLFLLSGKPVKMPFLCYTSSSTTSIKTLLPPHRPLFSSTCYILKSIPFSLNPTQFHTLCLCHTYICTRKKEISWLRLNHSLQITSNRIGIASLQRPSPLAGDLIVNLEDWHFNDPSKEDRGHWDFSQRQTPMGLWL